MLAREAISSSSTSGCFFSPKILRSSLPRDDVDRREEDDIQEDADRVDATEPSSSFSVSLHLSEDCEVS